MNFSYEAGCGAEGLTRETVNICQAQHRKGDRVTRTAQPQSLKGLCLLQI